MTPRSKTQSLDRRTTARAIGVVCAICLFVATALFMRRVLMLHVLVSAAWQGNVEKVRSLLNQGVDVNGEDVFYGLNSPMTSAVAAGRSDVVRLLLARGANPNSSIWNALQHDRLAMLRLLIANGVDVNQIADMTIERGEVLRFSPLDIATARGKPQIVEALRRAGARRHLADLSKLKGTPLD